jgi:GNAT superfamily N-acetyltransferase
MIASLRNAARELGWSNALLYGLSRLLQVTSGGRVRLLRYFLVAQSIPDQDVTPPRRGRSISVTEADASEIRRIDFGRPADVIEERLRLGCRCLLARKDGQLVGFQWFITRDYPEDEVRCVFELNPTDNCAWDFDIYVLPEARSQPVFLRLWDSCNALLRSEGIDLSLSRINAFNSASVRAHARMGAQTIGTAMFLSIGRAQVAWLPAIRCMHVSWDQAPRLPVSALARRKRNGI